MGACNFGMSWKSTGITKDQRPPKLKDKDDAGLLELKNVSTKATKTNVELGHQWIMAAMKSFASARNYVAKPKGTYKDANLAFPKMRLNHGKEKDVDYNTNKYYVIQGL
ncbi:hypothetical protein H6P81_015912 [Aristolochia fimbriata]|uniref:Uncharacterized protein n=1 Tax=Aristolochia fimbriata TaxID=158543 RepID=A0AAV7EA03_ARIFI|nr:hypothetical protein H6P81_015912 [Aristolochia fimbriata]